MQLNSMHYGVFNVLNPNIMVAAFMMYADAKIYREAMPYAVFEIRPITDYARGNFLSVVQAVEKVDCHAAV